MSDLLNATAATPLVVEKIYAHPAAAIWSALTDPDKMKHWYFPIAAFRPEVGFAFSFPGGTKDKTYIHECVVTEVVPERKLSFTWRYRDYPGNSTVCFELFPEGDRTRVVVTHTGLESFSRDDPNFARESFNKGWEHIFGTSLAGFLG